MAVTTSTASNPLVTTVVTDTDADITVETVVSGNQTLYAVEITNPNPNESVYVHMINAASNSTTATQHNTQLFCPAASSVHYYMPTGYLTSTGIQFYCSTSAGGGQSAVSPTDDVTVTFGCTAR